jgi:hypothetical protein
LRSPVQITTTVFPIATFSHGGQVTGGSARDVHHERGLTGAAGPPEPASKPRQSPDPP